MRKGRKEQAFEVLKRVRDSELDIQREIEHIENNLQDEKLKWSQLFSPNVRKALLVGITITAM